MSYELLARFIYESRDWSNLKRGIEVFQRASDLFKELFQIDSGFFVYKKRIPSEVSESFKIFQAWGSFEQSLVQTSLENFFQLDSEKWLDVNHLPFELNSNIKQLGIWKMYSRGELIGGIVLARSTPKIDDEEVISVCVKQVSLIIDMFLAWRSADEMSRYDIVTGVLNRRGISDLLETLIANARISGNTLMIGLLDIDNFKQINDCNGHPEGDRILLEIAQTLKNNIRSGDIVGRLGGDEFVLIMQTQNQNTDSLAERIEDLFPPSYGYTISVGFAVWNIDGTDWETCYHIADQRLYNRKSEKEVQLKGI